VAAKGSDLELMAPMRMHRASSPSWSLPRGLANPSRQKSADRRRSLSVSQPHTTATGANNLRLRPRPAEEVSRVDVAGVARC
jgi:hypothetical protein